MENRGKSWTDRITVTDTAASPVPNWQVSAKEQFIFERELRREARKLQSLIYGITHLGGNPYENPYKNPFNDCYLSR